ncbi:FliH/SctL family protein [Sphingosinicella sp.]|uniref:FliH/SctL family protein n=1 Tax=Sphingosinicella sp. TaxID=1917971 RepID=UPI004037B1D2
MSALLKGAAAALAARPLTARPTATLEIIAVEMGLSPEAVELEALRADYERLTEALAAAREQAESAVAEAIGKGRAQGRAEARADDEKKFELISEALAKASSLWEERLIELDGLAARIAGASAEKVFGPWEQASELVTRAARERLDKLRREAVLAIHVSAKDFPDDKALEAAAEQMGRPRNHLIADPDLAAGDCRIDLTLGHIDIGPRSQFAALAALLDDLAEGRSA